uniref:CLAVATA3/ESR-related-ROOT SIGNAL 3 n=1 Tax=Lotus japonicus TaxID=34305 RepID=A0A193PE84_LOTJA|nr:CLAVATA3/ESR-related-ROOT SIGNAL 3 [Lotus japonicus]
MANASRIMRVFIVMLMMSTLFIMSLVQARSLERRVDSQHLLQMMKHKHPRRALEDWISPGGPDPKHNKQGHG